MALCSSTFASLSDMCIYSAAIFASCPGGSLVGLLISESRPMANLGRVYKVVGILALDLGSLSVK